MVISNVIQWNTQTQLCNLIIFSYFYTIFLHGTCSETEFAAIFSLCYNLCYLSDEGNRTLVALTQKLCINKANVSTLQSS